MSVLTASTLHNINGAYWKGSRQAAQLTFCWQAHRFLHGNILKVKCDHICPVPKAATFVQKHLWITVDNSQRNSASRDALRHARKRAISTD
jgi:hypothetical protein